METGAAQETWRRVADIDLGNETSSVVSVISGGVRVLRPMRCVHGLAWTPVAASPRASERRPAACNVVHVCVRAAQAVRWQASDLVYIASNIAGWPDPAAACVALACVLRTLAW